MLNRKLAERKGCFPSEKENELAVEESLSAGTEVRAFCYHSEWQLNEFQEEEGRKQFKDLSMALSRKEEVLSGLRDASREMKANYEAKEAADKSIISTHTYYMCSIKYRQFL